MTVGLTNTPISRDDAERASPASTAAFDKREAWCLDYTEWFIAQLPAEEPPPADARPTQRFESEFNSCKLDPQEYERLTRTEVYTATENPER